MSNTTEVKGRNLAVLGFFFKEDSNATNIPFLESVNSMIEDGLNVETSTTGHNYTLDFFSLFTQVPHVNMFWHYEGSLTTPPCTESVNWYMNNNYIKVNRK